MYHSPVRDPPLHGLRRVSGTSSPDVGTGIETARNIGSLRVSLAVNSSRAVADDDGLGLIWTHRQASRPIFESFRLHMKFGLHALDN